ncbi:MAG: hypothetical protein DCC58_21135, partial [Chloroflexi bacterium]
MVQETLYHDLSLAERAQLHLAVSEALEAGDAQALPWAALTYHLLGAGPLGDLNKLVRYAQRSGDEAMAQFAWEAAATHFAHALRALEQSDVNDSTLRCDLLLDLGEAYNRSGPGSGDVPRAREHFLEAFQLARELGSPERMARAAVGFAGLNIVTAFGGVRQLQLLEDALAALDPVDSPLRVRVLCNLAVDLWNRSTANYERCSALSDEAVAMARRLGDPALIALALWARHYSGWQPVNLAERLVLAQQLVDYADMSGAPVIAAWAYVSLSLDYTDAGNLPDAERAIAALRRLDERTRIPYVALRAAVYGGMLELLTGHYAAAIESVARAEALWESDTPRQHQIQTYCLLRDLGRLSELRDGIRLPDPSNPWRAATQAHRMLLALDRGQSEAAHADYADLAKDDFAQVGFNAFWFGAVVPLAEAAIAFGDTVNAARLCALLEPFAERLAFVGILGVCHGPVALYLGRLATALGDWETADKRLEQALAMSERLAIRPY